MARINTSRDPLLWILVGALVCLIIGAVLPPLVENRSRPLSNSEQITVNSAVQEAQMLDVVNFLTGGESSDDGSHEICSKPGAPLRCYQKKTTAMLQRVTNTSPTAEDSVVNSDSLMRVVVDGNVVAEINEHSELNRESAYPQPGPTNNQTVVVADLGTGVSSEGFEREGLRFFFPSKTEQRSYPYYDPMTSRADPIDFTGTEEIDGIPVYVFHQKVSGINLVNTVDVTLAQGEGTVKPELQQSTEGMRTTAPAMLFYDKAEREKYGYGEFEEVTVDPWYAVERTVWVEPTTGSVLNMEEKIYTYFAEDKQQAEEMAFAGWSENRTLIAANFAWDDQAKAQALGAVEDTVALIKLVSIAGWFGKILAVILLAVAGVKFMRRRKAA